MALLFAAVSEEAHDESSRFDHHGDNSPRLLAASSSGKELQIDYSVLAVLVMTLGLIMIVEVARHRLDQAAKSRPFFKSVLKGVYTERTRLQSHNTLSTRLELRCRSRALSPLSIQNFFLQ
jgi:hypothetical protein